MKFAKLRLHGVPDKGVVEGWYLLITNMAELQQYCEVDAGKFTQALFSMRKETDEQGNNVRIDHLSSSHEKILGVTIESKTLSSTAGVKIWPHEIVGEIVSKKFSGMMHFLTNVGTIQINEAGGWCGHVGFLSTWRGEVISQIEKPDCVFPIDEAPYSADVLFLENGTFVTQDFYRAVMKVHDGKHKSIVELKHKDPEWVYKSIINCPVIATETQLVDEMQVEKMMQLFKSISRKKVIIRTSDENKLRRHKDFAHNSEKHEIIFI